MMSNVAMSVNYDSFTNLVRYPQLLATRHLSWQAKCTYIPLVSNVKGLIEIICTVAQAGLFLVSAALGIAMFGVTFWWAIEAKNDSIMILNWFNFPAMIASYLYYKISDDALSTIGRGLIQQVPVIGNAVLASYDIKKYQV